MNSTVVNRSPQLVYPLLLPDMLLQLDFHPPPHKFSNFTMRCCPSDWPGLFLFCFDQPLCVSQQSWWAFLFHKFSHFPPPPQLYAPLLNGAMGTSLPDNSTTSQLSGRGRISKVCGCGRTTQASLLYIWYVGSTSCLCHVFFYIVQKVVVFDHPSLPHVVSYVYIELSIYPPPRPARLWRIWCSPWPMHGPLSLCCMIYRWVTWTFATRSKGSLILSSQLRPDTSLFFYFS